LRPEKGENVEKRARLSEKKGRRGKEGAKKKKVALRPSAKERTDAFEVRREKGGKRGNMNDDRRRFRWRTSRRNKEA